MHFDLSISLGSILTILGLASHAAFVWKKTVARHAVDQATLERHEQWIKEHEQCNRQQIAILNEVREALAYLKGRLAS